MKTIFLATILDSRGADVFRHIVADAEGDVVLHVRDSPTLGSVRHMFPYQYAGCPMELSGKIPVVVADVNPDYVINHTEDNPCVDDYVVICSEFNEKDWCFLDDDGSGELVVTDDECWM